MTFLRELSEEMLVREWIPRSLRHILAFSVRWGQFYFSYILKNIVLVAPSQEHAFSNKRFNRIYLYSTSRRLLDSVADDYMSREDIVVFIGLPLQITVAYFYSILLSALSDSHPYDSGLQIGLQAMSSGAKLPIRFPNEILVKM